MPVARRGYTRPQRTKPEIPKPTTLGGLASDYWDSIVPALIDRGIAETVDASALEALCQWWAEYQKLQQAEPTDAGEAYKRSIAMASAFKHWETLASKFGLNPQSREKITARPFADESVVGEYLS